MLMFNLEKIAAWAPGIGAEHWDSWRRGEAAIQRTNESPGLKFMPALSRRRLSQLSRMVLHVGNELVGDNEDIPVIYHSRFGEVNRQYMISKGLLEDQEVSPSGFSQSVFNTPVALLSIFKKNTDLNSAVFGCPAAAFIEAVSKISSCDGSSSVLLYGDELLPDEYLELTNEPPLPFCFGLRISQKNSGDRFSIQSVSNTATQDSHPLDLLLWLLSGQKEPFLFSSQGLGLLLERAK